MSTTDHHAPPLRRLVAVAVAALALVGCGDDASDDETAVTWTDSEPDDQTGEDSVVIQARDNVFLSEAVTVSTGTEVTFENRGRNDHNVIPVIDGAFEAIEVEDFAAGQHAAITFDEAGTYAYYCTLHGTEKAGMIGTIVVTD